MLRALMPSDVMPGDSQVDVIAFDGTTEADLNQVGFYVQPYLGPLPTLSIIERMPNLQVVQVLTAGFDNALPFIPEGVKLCNAVGVHDAGTAEIAIGLALASLRGIDDHARAMSSGKWIHDRRESLADRRVIVVGAGGVGQAIARRLQPFEVDTTLVARTARDGIRSMDELSDLLPAADIVFLAVPLNDETRHLVDDAFLARMPDGALLVNVARGLVVDTAALTEHLRRGRIRAALDVTDPEPLPADHPLWQMPGALISPHVGGDCTAFTPRARRLVAQQYLRWRDGATLEHIVKG